MRRKSGSTNIEAEPAGGGSLRKKAVTGTKWSFVSKILNILLQLGSLSVLSRLLVPEDFGLLAIAMVVVTFGQIFSDAGISAAIVQRGTSSREELSSLYWLNVLGGVSVTLVYLLCIPVVEAFFVEPRLRELLLWLAPIFIFTAFGQQSRLLLEREMKFRAISIIETLNAVIAAAVAIGLATLGFGVLSLVWSSLASAALGACMLNLVCWRRWRPRMHFRGADVTPVLRFGLFQMGEKFLNYWGWQWDKIIIGLTLGSQLLGFYSLAYRLALYPIQTINPVLNRVTFPLFSKVQRDDAKLRGGFLFIIRSLSMVTMPIFAGVLVTSDLVVEVLLGAQWTASGPILSVLAILGFFFTIGNPIGSLLLAKGRADIGFYMNVWMTVTYGAAAWIGSRFGVVGVAWALVVAQALLVFPIGFPVRFRLVGMRALEFVGAFAPFLAMSLAMAGGVWALRRSAGLDGGVTELVVAGAAGAVLYLGQVLVFQRGFVKEVLRTARNR